MIWRQVLRRITRSDAGSAARRSWVRQRRTSASRERTRPARRSTTGSRRNRSLRHRRPCCPGAVDDHGRGTHRGGHPTWAIVGDPHRFIRAKQVARYTGLDPSIVQSGEQHRQGRISKAGSPLLRTLLVEAPILSRGGIPVPSVSSTPARRRKSGPAKQSSRRPGNFSS